RQIPAFGSWNYYDDLPITQYFESAMQAGLVRGQSFVEDADLYQKRGGDKQYQTGQQRKQGKVCDVTVTAPATPRRIRAPKAVDEDLYKIPPELLYQKPKRTFLSAEEAAKRVVRMPGTALRCVRKDGVMV
ncbi:hypothetical protein B296_00003823, partial [Ensete ventricosum]